MSLQDFSSLVQVQSLENKIHDHLKKIEGHENRITFLNKQRDTKKNELEKLEISLAENKKIISEDEKNLFKYESDLEKTKSHISQATSQQQADALEKELSTLNPKIEELEEKILINLDEQESIIEKQNVCTKFIDGSVETLEEIKKEVKADCEIENKEIAKYQERIALLFEECPDNYKSLFLNLNKKFKYKSPVTSVNNGHCNSCRFAVTSVQKSAVETGNNIELCSSCGRLFAPFSAFNA